jgi:arylsulfatase A-like enzyme
MGLHLGSFGSDQVQTPNLDSLATAGVRYTRVFTTAGVCAPSRSAIITGMYQQSIGTQHMRTLTFTDPPGSAYPPGYRGYSAVIPAQVRCFPEYLREAGYYCTNNDKQDYQFEAPPTVWDESSKKAHWRNRPDPGQPFFSVFNLTTTHESKVWARAREPLLVNPRDVVVPPYYPDIDQVRQDLARHLSNVMVMDGQAGEILRQLRQDGLEDNTIVFFYSDHGDGLPNAKRELYDRGLRVPLIVRFGKNVAHLNPHRQANTQQTNIIDDQLISGVDLAPTVLSLAGVKIPAYMQGQAFLGNQKAARPRTHIFAARDRMDSEYDRVRAARDQRFLYLRNYMPEKPYYQNIAFRLQQPMMQAILELRDKGKLDSLQMQWFRPNKPAEELYDCQADPHQLNNLAANPAYKDKLTELRNVYNSWITRTGDWGAMPESEMVRQWWHGADQPPVTAAPQIRKENKRLTLTCPTPGASIGYRYGTSGPWRVYTRPLPAGRADSLYVIAQRIGYQKSRTVTTR